MFGGTIKLTPTGLAVILGSTSLLILLYWNSSSGRDKVEKISLRNLLQIGIVLAEKGGEKIVQVHEINHLNEKVKGKTKEGVKEPVTDADLRSHRIIVDNLKKYYPNIQVISEEHDEEDVDVVEENVNLRIENGLVKELEGVADEMVLAREITVWVDPLDATKEFTESLLKYVTTMVCVAVKGKATIGIIHNPFSKETVWGWTGSTTSSNIRPGTNSEDASKHRIIVSRSHAGLVRDVVIAAFGNTTEVIPAGGAGYKTVQVIRGAVEAYVHVTLIKKWDLCAANALINAVGGKMTTLSGQQIDYDSNSGFENPGGLLATMHDHQKYLNLLKVFDSVS